MQSYYDKSAERIICKVSPANLEKKPRLMIQFDRVINSITGFSAVTVSITEV